MFELSEKDKENGGEKKLEKSADWDGPIKDRSCTDCLFIVVSIYLYIYIYIYCIFMCIDLWRERGLIYEYQ